MCLQLLTRAQCEQSEKLERKDMSGVLLPSKLSSVPPDGLATLVPVLKLCIAVFGSAPAEV